MASTKDFDNIVRKWFGFCVRNNKVHVCINGAGAASAAVATQNGSLKASYHFFVFTSFIRSNLSISVSHFGSAIV